jgi:hypothetical protein
MEITISEFRKNIKDYFNAALNGEVVCIERGGIHYNLTARLPKLVKTIVEDSPTTSHTEMRPEPVILDKLTVEPIKVNKTTHNPYLEKGKFPPSAASML